MRTWNIMFLIVLHCGSYLTWQVAYEAIGDTRTFLEAAAARGFEHVSASTLDTILSDLQIKAGVRARHQKAMHIIDAMQSTWGWSRVDMARALMRVLPETKGVNPRHRKGPDKPQRDQKYIWDDIPSIAAALQAREDGLPEVRKVEPQDETGALVQALCVMEKRSSAEVHRVICFHLVFVLLWCSTLLRCLFLHTLK